MCGLSTLLLMSPDALAEGEEREDTDTDNDGIIDEIERRTNTDPLDPDTDDDTVPDGQEDANQDGVVDPGESDPRVAGLFPGSAPHIPEPMSFDLVRGLGAHKGEVETNILATARPRSGQWGETTWAPEVEWAIIDGLAVEAELPMVDRELEALKLAVQWTAPLGSERFTHGLQAIGEAALGHAGADAAVLYLAGLRVQQWSLFAMAGGRAARHGQETHTEALLNPSVFYDANEALTLGIETNLAASTARLTRPGGQVVPQVHWQLSRRCRVQAGGGVEWHDGVPGATATTRIILE